MTMDATSKRIQCRRRRRRRTRSIDGCHLVGMWWVCVILLILLLGVTEWSSYHVHAMVRSKIPNNNNNHHSKLDRSRRPHERRQLLPSQDFTHTSSLPPLQPVKSDEPLPDYLQRNIPLVYTNDPKTVCQWLQENLPMDCCTIGFDVEVGTFCWLSFFIVWLCCDPV